MDLHLPRGLPPRQTRFLCLLAARPSLTRADYQRLLNVSHNTAHRDLAQLVRARLITPRGTATTRRYALGPAAILPSSGHDVGVEMVGSSHQDLATVTITVHPLSL